MTISKPRILALGSPAGSGLIASYGRALATLDVDVRWWDLKSSVDRNTPLGKPGRVANNFLHVEPWVRKANREFFTAVAQHKPNAIIGVANSPLLAGTLAQLRTTFPDIAKVLLWPDTLINLRSYVVAALPMYDLVATYSRATLDAFRSLGAREVIWLPFGGDHLYFPPDGPELTAFDRHKYECDVVVVGNYRAERERGVLLLRDAGLRVRVWGTTSWKQATNKVALEDYWEGSPLFGEDMAKAIRFAKISLNQIDPANYPGANMRFFETLASGGTSLTSRCPEFEDEFRDAETCRYFASLADMVETAKELVAMPALRRSIAERGQELVLQNHTYVDRAKRLLAAIDEIPRRSRTTPA